MAKPPAEFNRCISGVLAASGKDDLTDDDLITIFQRARGRIASLMREGRSQTEAAYEAGMQLGQEMRLAAAIEKRSLAINRARRNEILGQIRAGKEVSDMRRLLSSVDSAIYGAQAEVLGPLVADMKKAGLLKAISRNDPAFDQRVIDELWQINSGKTGSVTNDPMARKAAEIITSAQDRVRAMQNNAGAWIGKTDHYVTKQSHDMDKVRGTLTDAKGAYDANKNFENWRDKILPRLDEKTFDHLENQTPEGIDAYLRNVWQSLASGVHDTARGNEVLAAFKGPANLAKRISQERKLLFKDAQAWGDYNREFGRGSVWESIQRSLDTGSRNAAIMRTLGTNPEAMYDGIVDRLKSTAKERNDFTAIDNLNKSFNKNVLDTITGKANVPGNSTFAAIARGTMIMQTLSKLGGVVLSSFPDLATNAAALRHNGIGLFESYGNQIASLFPKNAATKEAMLQTGVGIESMLNHAITRFYSGDAVAGRGAKLVDIFHRINLLTWWTDSLKYGLGSVLTNNMGRNAQVAFDALDPRWKVTLGKYGIGAKDWDMARATAAKGADGVDRILPAEIADEAVRTKFQTYLIDQIRIAMTEPDAVSRTVVTGGLHANTAAGMAMRVMTQFKTYPVTFINRTLGREGLNPWADNFGKNIDVPGVVQLIAGASLLGYASIELKNLARGRNTRTSEADSQAAYFKLVTASMLQGGGLGIFGDFIFGDTGRGAGTIASTLLGPTGGTLEDLTKVMQETVKALGADDPRAAKSALSGAIGLVRDNTPFANLFYTRAMMEHLIWFRLQEAANPGYLARYEDRMRREDHQTFWLSPSAAR
jgi:hypothetical protein